MKGVNEQDAEEFEMLLGEIPNSTSAGNIQCRESSIMNLSLKLASVDLSEQTMGKTSDSNNVTNFYNALQSQNPGVNDVSISPVPGSPISSSSVSSLYNCLNLEDVYNHITQKEGNLDGHNNTAKKKFRGPNQITDQEASCMRLKSNLSDDQSLVPAFAYLSLKSGRNIDLMSESPVHHKGFPGSGFPHSLNRVSSQNFATSYARGMVNEQHIAANGEDSGMVFNANTTDAKSHTLDEYPTTLVRQHNCLPMPSRPMQLNAGIQAFQVPSSGPVSGVEFPINTYQQQCYLDSQGSQFLQPQQYGHLNSMPVQDLNSTHVLWQHMDEDRCRAIQQHFVHLHHPQNQCNMSHNQLQPSTNGFAGSLIRNSSLVCYDIPVSHAQHFNEALYWNRNVIPQGLSQSNIIPLGRSLCGCYAQGSCSRGDSCPFVHEHSHTAGSAWSCPSHSFSFEKEGKQIFPEKILTRSHGLNSLRSLKSSSILSNNVASLAHANCNGRVFANGYCNHHPSILTTESLLLRGQNSGGSLPDKLEGLSPRSRHHLKCTSLDEIEGKVFALAKDQDACRFLQDKCVNGTADDVEKIFVEIIDDIVDLMKDPFGNYLVQKFLDVCNENQRMQLLYVITKNPGDLVEVSCNMHGTRSVQKVIDTLKTPEEITMVVSSLKHGAVKLTKDLNGNHVLQHCLQCLDSKYNEFLFNAVVAHCVDIATHRHGCCVLQKCLQFSDSEPRRKLVDKIAQNALLLSQDPFGNYVVQYVCEKLQWATPAVIDHLKGHFVYLSTQKCSSNVVEKCLRSAPEEWRTHIIEELMNDPHLDQLLQGPFANYVVQSALASSKGEAVHAAFVDAIKPHLPALKHIPYGKRIISYVNSRSK